MTEVVELEEVEEEVRRWEMEQAPHYLTKVHHSMQYC